MKKIIRKKLLTVEDTTLKRRNTSGAVRPIIA